MPAPKPLFLIGFFPHFFYCRLHGWEQQHIADGRAIDVYKRQGIGRQRIYQRLSSHDRKLKYEWNIALGWDEASTHPKTALRKEAA